MTAVSGRAGLFTINAFNPNITDDTHATTRGQKSGALRLEFGKVLVANAAVTSTSARMGINTGIMVVVTPSRVPDTTAVVKSGGTWAFAASSFLSGVLKIDCQVTGEYSGLHSGMAINYMVVGY